MTDDPTRATALAAPTAGSARQIRTPIPATQPAMRPGHGPVPDGVPRSPRPPTGTAPRRTGGAAPRTRHGLWTGLILSALVLLFLLVFILQNDDAGADQLPRPRRAPCPPASRCCSPRSPGCCSSRSRAGCASCSCGAQPTGGSGLPTADPDLPGLRAPAPGAISVSASLRLTTTTPSCARKASRFGRDGERPISTPPAASRGTRNCQAWVSGSGCPPSSSVASVQGPQTRGRAPAGPSSRAPAVPDAAMAPMAARFDRGVGRAGTGVVLALGDLRVVLGPPDRQVAALLQPARPGRRTSARRRGGRGRPGRRRMPVAASTTRKSAPTLFCSQ